MICFFWGKKECKNGFFREVEGIWRSREEALRFFIFVRKIWGRVALSGEKKDFWGLQNVFSFGAWLRRPGGQGGFRPPPYAPLDPLYPLQTAEGYPRTPLVAKGVLPLVSRPTGSVSGTPSVWSGPATNRVPERARALYGTDAGARTAAGYSYRGCSLPPLQG